MGRDESEYREYLIEQDRRLKFQDEPEPDDELLDLDEIDDSDDPDPDDDAPPVVNPRTGYPAFPGVPTHIEWYDADKLD